MSTRGKGRSKFAIANFQLPILTDRNRQLKIRNLKTIHG